MRSIYQHYKRIKHIVVSHCFALLRFAAKRWFKDELASNKKVLLLDIQSRQIGKWCVSVFVSDRVHLKMHSCRGLFVREFIIKRCAADWTYFFFGMRWTIFARSNLIYAQNDMRDHGWSFIDLAHTHTKSYCFSYTAFCRMHFIFFCIIILILFTTIDN